MRYQGKWEEAKASRKCSKKIKARNLLQRDGGDFISFISP